MACTDYKITKEIHSLIHHDDASHCSNRGGCQACIPIADLDERIQDTVSSLRKLLEERQTRRTELNKAHSSIISKMPPEILSMIFHLSSTGGSSTIKKSKEWSESRDTEYSPLTLTATCRHWREVALSTPELWTHLSIHIAYDCGPERIKFLEEWISRSKSLPLTLFLYGRPSPVSCQSLLDTLCQYSRRWEYITSNITNSLLFPLFARDVSSLRGIWLLENDIKSKVEGGREEKEKEGPRPEILQIDRRQYLEGLNINLTGLTHVKAKFWSTFDCINLVQHAPLLVTFEVTHVYSSDRKLSDEFHIPIEHQSLRTLKFSGTDDDIMEFFATVNFPGICNFKLHTRGHFGLGSSEQLELQRFFKHNCSQLENFSMNGSCVSYSALSEILSSAPSLISLNLEGLGPNRVAEEYPALLLSKLAQTTATDVQKQFLPCLQIIRFQSTICHLEVARDLWLGLLDVFGPVNAIGKPGQRPLRELDLQDSYSSLSRRAYIPPDFDARLEALRRAGLNINIKSLNGGQK